MWAQLIPSSRSLSITYSSSIEKRGRLKLSIEVVSTVSPRLIGPLFLGAPGLFSIMKSSSTGLVSLDRGGVVICVPGEEGLRPDERGTARFLGFAIGFRIRPC